MTCWKYLKGGVGCQQQSARLGGHIVGSDLDAWCQSPNVGVRTENVCERSTDHGGRAPSDGRVAGWRSSGALSVAVSVAMDEVRQRLRKPERGAFGELMATDALIRRSGPRRIQIAVERAVHMWFTSSSATTWRS